MEPRPQTDAICPEGLVKSLVIQALAEGKPARLKFCGLSMSPLLAPGDSILVEKMRRPARKGDIVLYLAAGEFVAHRVIGLSKHSGTVVVTKGDATVRCSEELPADSIIGIVTARERGGRRLELSGPGQRALARMASALSPFAVLLLRAAPRPLRSLARRIFEIVAERL